MEEDEIGQREGWGRMEDDEKGQRRMGKNGRG